MQIYHCSTGLGMQSTQTKTTLPVLTTTATRRPAYVTPHLNRHAMCVRRYLGQRILRDIGLLLWFAERKSSHLNTGWLHNITPGWSHITADQPTVSLLSLRTMFPMCVIVHCGFHRFGRCRRLHLRHHSGSSPYRGEGTNWIVYCTAGLVSCNTTRWPRHRLTSVVVLATEIWRNGAVR